MAEKKMKQAAPAEAEAVTEPVQETVTPAAATAAKPKKTTQAESIYSCDELAFNAKVLFGTTRDVVAAALTMAGKASATIPEAKTIVDAFSKKEVKK